MELLYSFRCYTLHSRKSPSRKNHIFTHVRHYRAKFSGAWQSRGSYGFVRGCHVVYVEVTGSMSRSFSRVSC